LSIAGLALRAASSAAPAIESTTVWALEDALFSVPEPFDGSEGDRVLPRTVVSHSSPSVKEYVNDYQHDDWHTQQPSENIFAHDHYSFEIDLSSHSSAASSVPGPESAASCAYSNCPLRRRSLCTAPNTNPLAAAICRNVLPYVRPRTYRRRIRVHAATAPANIAGKGWHETHCA
jgi:hypothetical protein